MRYTFRTIATLIGSFVLASGAQGQVHTPAQFALELNIDSGPVANTTDDRGVIYAEVVHVGDASWLRLAFSEATLGASPAGGKPTVLRITSLEDGARQHLQSFHLEQWRDTSAYFNGDALLMEIIADPGAGPSRLHLTGGWAGPLVPATAETICGANDDRTLSNDVRVGRLWPIGCTGWIINDANNCFLTAGHCSGSSAEVMEFNVPLSSGGGMPQHPGPEDQYPVDIASKQSQNGGIGQDWGYFGCFANTETGLTAAEVQGAFFVLAATPPPVSGQNIRITGYGTTSSPVPPEWNQAQKTHAGPYTNFGGTTVQYETDTTGGNSGSPVIDSFTGQAIGIHTHGGCDSSGGENNGTGTNHGGLQNALSNPQGVCIPVLPLQFSYPNGLPEQIPPTGAVIRVEVGGQNGGEPESGTGLLHVDEGSGFATLAMIQVEPNVYDATFPALECGGVVRFYFSAESSEAQEVNDPSNAPTTTYEALVAVLIDVEFADDFESDSGWTVENVDLLDGGWERGVPAGGDVNPGDRGDPPVDADGSGQCYVTDNTGGNSDVDGGPTRLISPIIDASVLDDPIVQYARWFTNDDDDLDAMVVEVSDDGGGTWTEVEIVTGNTSWVFTSFRVADHVTPNDQLRVRFSVSDNPNDSVTEAGVDAFEVISVGCGEEDGDVNGDGLVDFTDLVLLLANWGPCPDPPAQCVGDLDGDGNVSFTDLVEVLAAWTTGGG